jgi:hypothetical protein
MKKFVLPAVVIFFIFLQVGAVSYLLGMKSSLSSDDSVSIKESDNYQPSYNLTPEVSDARPKIVENYLATYNSVLTPLSEYIVKISDMYGLDYRLLPAIAQQESNLCKKIPPESFNCWGWGIHSEGSLGFQSFESAIKVVASGLSTEYIGKGLVTPEQIMRKYTPGSNGSWAFGVQSFMDQMK